VVNVSLAGNKRCFENCDALWTDLSLKKLAVSLYRERERERAKIVPKEAKTGRFLEKMSKKLFTPSAL
jgi:hypothetical protein